MWLVWHGGECGVHVVGKIRMYRDGNPCESSVVSLLPCSVIFVLFRPYMILKLVPGIPWGGRTLCMYVLVWLCGGNMLVW